jgi:cell division protein FtsB
LTLFLIIAGCAVVYLFVFGDSGLLERARLQREREALAQRLADAEEAHAGLLRLVERYRRGELMDQEAHRAGFLAPGEKMLFVSDTPDSPRARRKAAPELRKRGSAITAARIVWIVVSGILVLLYFTRRRRSLEPQ